MFPVPILYNPNNRGGEITPEQAPIALAVIVITLIICLFILFKPLKK